MKSDIEIEKIKIGTLKLIGSKSYEIKRKTNLFDQWIINKTDKLRQESNNLHKLLFIVIRQRNDEYMDRQHRSVHVPDIPCMSLYY